MATPFHGLKRTFDPGKLKNASHPVGDPLFSISTTRRILPGRRSATENEKLENEYINETNSVLPYSVDPDDRNVCR
jgi:hypothetical protein